MPAHRKSTGMRKRAQPAATDGPAEAEAKAAASTSRAKRARGAAREAVAVPLPAAEEYAMGAGGDDLAVGRAETEGEDGGALPPPPPGRRTTRSGLAKEDGRADEPSPLGVRVKEEGGVNGSGPEGLDSMRQALVQAETELGWLSAGKNLLDFGQGAELKLSAATIASAPAPTLAQPAAEVSTSVAGIASGAASPRMARGPGSMSVGARPNLSRVNSKQPAPISSSHTPSPALAVYSTAAATAPPPAAAENGPAASSAPIASTSGIARHRHPRNVLPHTSVASAAAAAASEAAAPAAVPASAPAAAPAAAAASAPAAAAPAEAQPQPATWTIKQWRKLAEPQRNKTHWDYLLEEMEWLSKDFKEERAWKVALARKAVRAVGRWHQERAQLESRENRSEEARVRRVASSISREVLDVWGQVARVAQYKHEQRLEAKRLETRNKQLDFLVGQTARYTSMITEGLTGAADSSDSESSDTSRKRARVEKANRLAELEALQREAEAPIDEDLLRAVEQESEEDDDEEEGEEAQEALTDPAHAPGDARGEFVTPADGAEGAESAVLAAPEPSAAAPTLAAPVAAGSTSAMDVETADAHAATGPSVEEAAAAPATASCSNGARPGAEEMEDPAEDIDIDAEEAAKRLEGKSGRERMESTLASASSLKPTGDTLATANVRVQVPFLIRGTLREYQHVALDWMVSMYEKNLNGILADEMGLGKTLMTISMLAWLACERGVWGPHLIVVPTSVMLNWEMEIKKFCPAFKILTYFGTQKERKLKRQGWSKTNAFHVCITSYKLVIQDQAAFRRKKWKYLVLDEAHHIKNFRSQRWQTLLNFNAKRRLLLTGTPLQNNLMELWSLLHFLMPHIFESHKEFKDWFSNPVSGMIEGTESVDQQVIERLHAILRPFLLRRLKKDVEKSLKDKIEHVVPCPLSKRQRELYEDFMSSSTTRATLGGGSMLGIMNVLMQLRKVCNHPDLFEERPIRSPHMMSALLVTAAADTARVLERGPLDAPLDLDLLNLNLASYCDLDSYDAFRTYALRTRTVHITEVSTRRLSSEPTLAAAGVSSSFTGLGSASGQADGCLAPPIVPALSPLRSHILSAHERRLAWRRSVRATIALVNERRCARTPLWGYGLRKSAIIPLVVDSLCSLATADVVPLDMPTALSGTGELILSYQRRFESCRTALEAFTTQITRARAPPPRLSTRHDPSDAARAQLRQQALAIVPRDKLTLLQPVVVRQSLSFPDKRLIQWDCGKLQVLANLLRKLHAGGHRCLIFTQMTKMLNVLEAWICMMGFTYLRLDGATKTEDRQRLMDRFNLSPKIFLFILATRAGGLGINLTGADTVIFYDSDWNPTIDAQAQDRAHRIGQTKQVHIYRLVSEATVEENILRKANQKRLLDSVVIQAGSFTTDFLKGGADGLRELFATDASDSKDAPVSETERPSTPAPSEPSPSSGRSRAPSGRKGRGGRGAKKDAAKSAAGAELASEERRPAPTAAPATAEPSVAELEAAMLSAQDAEDVEAWEREREVAAADAAEFDESIPFREDAECGDLDGRGGGDTAMSGNESDMPPPAARQAAGSAGRRVREAAESPVTEEAAVASIGIINDAEDARDFAEVVGSETDGSILQQLEAALTPVQRYMLRILEEAQEADAAEAERELQWEEWEMERLARRREEEERLADEDDEVLYYAVPESKPSAVSKKRGRGGKGSANEPSASGAPSYLTNVAHYLQQQLARSGLERSEELESLEMQLWGPPAPPDRDTDEPYAPPALASDGEAPLTAAGADDSEAVAILPSDTFHTLHFSALVTEGVQGLQRVRQQISERRARARDAENARETALTVPPVPEDIVPGRASGRARKAPLKMGADEEAPAAAQTIEDSLSLIEPPALPPFEPPPAPRDVKRSHKKRRPGEAPAAAGFAPAATSAIAKGARAAAKAAGAAAKKEMPRASPEAPWMPEEDAALLRTIHAYGSTNWELISEVVHSLAPQHFRSSRSCHDRAAILLPSDDGQPREPGTTLSAMAGPGAPQAALDGSLGALPTPMLIETSTMEARAQPTPGVGAAMRKIENIRTNALQASSLQAETTQQVKLFALLTKLVHTAHLVEAAHLPRFAASATPHKSHEKFSSAALEAAAVRVAALRAAAVASEGDRQAPSAGAAPSAAPVRPLSPRSLAPLAADALAKSGDTQATQAPLGSQGLRLASGGDPFMKPFTPASARPQQAASRSGGQTKTSASSSNITAASSTPSTTAVGANKAKPTAQRRPSAKAPASAPGAPAPAAAAPTASTAKGKGSRAKKPAAPAAAASCPAAALSISAAASSAAPAAVASGGAVGISASAAAQLPNAQALSRAAAGGHARQLPAPHQLQAQYGIVGGVAATLSISGGTAAARAPTARAAPAASMAQQRGLSSQQQRANSPAAIAGLIGAPMGTPPNLHCGNSQPCACVSLPSVSGSSLASSSGIGLPQQSSATGAPGQSPAVAGGSRPMAKGLPMSVLMEVIKQHPSLKSRIHEIVSRKDISEAEKMAQIQRIVREANKS